jgi:hypothetical protein
MSIWDSYGAPTFGLEDCKIATWLAVGSYETAVDVPSIQLLGHNLETVNAILEGDDKHTAVHSTIVGGEIRMRFGSISFAAYTVLTGKDPYEYGTTPTRTKLLRINSTNFPYIGIVGKSVAVEGTGDLHVFLPKAKIMEGFEVQMEYGGFAIPEVTLRLVANDNGAFAEYFEHETAEAVVMPPQYS